MAKGAPTRIDDTALRLAASRPPSTRPRGNRKHTRFPPKEAFAPTGEHDMALCPLCMAPHPDTTHYATHRCDDVEQLSGPLRRTTAALLRSLQAGTPSGAPLPQALAGWLAALNPPAKRTGSPHSPFPDDSSFTDLSKTSSWPSDLTTPPPRGCHFILMPTSVAFNKKLPPPFRLYPTLTIPAHQGIRTPATDADGGAHTPPLCFDKDLVLCSCGPKPPPPHYTPRGGAPGPHPLLGSPTGSRGPHP